MNNMDLIIKKYQRRCAVQGCETRKKRINKISFHKFPKKGGDDWLHWVRACQNEELSTFDLQTISSKSFFICHLHFEESNFYCNKKGQFYLKTGTIPTLNLPTNNDENQAEVNVDLPMLSPENCNEAQVENINTVQSANYSTSEGNISTVKCDKPEENLDENFQDLRENSEEAQPKRDRKRGRKGFRDQTTSHYGKWSKWSPCTRSCTTQRHRWCRKPGICGRDVIRESAYCYVDGSFCQRWIHRKIRGSNEDDNDEDSVLDEFEVNPNNIENIAVAKDDGTWKCGIINNYHSKNSRLSYFTRIIGGRPSAPGSWPWQVAILNRFREAFCGGTLVSPRWVLTAAHCIRKRLFVRIGEHDLTVKEGTELELRVDSIMIHPEYDADTVDNDVALLRLPMTLTPSASRGIACLPSPRQSLPTKQRCTIIGWGKSRTDDDFGTDVLYEAEIPIVSSQMCRGIYVDYRITENMFCAGDLRGRMDSCNGDSGGPLLCRDPRKPNHPWTIFGITSFGEGCGKPGKFGIYARTTNYVRWIAKVINENDAFS